MPQFPDYYKLLNITLSATQEEVRQAYRKESLKLVLSLCVTRTATSINPGLTPTALLTLILPRNKRRQKDFRSIYCPFSLSLTYWHVELGRSRRLLCPFRCPETQGIRHSVYRPIRPHRQSELNIQSFCPVCEHFQCRSYSGLWWGWYSAKCGRGVCRCVRRG